MSKSNTRKSCVVPKCKSTTTKAPEKLFFSVPMDIQIRKKWIKVMKRLDPFGDKSKVYCCEDHFDIENDMENYIKYKLVGGKLQLKKGTVPHKFKCQEENNDKTERSAVKKRGVPQRKYMDQITTTVIKLIKATETGSVKRPEGGNLNLETDTKNSKRCENDETTKPSSDCPPCGLDITLKDVTSPDDTNNQHDSEEETHEYDTPPRYKISTNVEERRKIRGDNWSVKEKELLRRLTSQSANLIEHKSTTRSVNLLKAKEWRKITTRLNKLLGTRRSLMEVKLCWSRMKMAAKAKSCHEIAHEKAASSITDIKIRDIKTEFVPCDFQNGIYDHDYEVRPVTPIDVMAESRIPSNEPNFTGESEISSEMFRPIRTPRKFSSYRKINLLNSTQELRQSILKSNLRFSKRQLEMMEEEHQYNMQIAKLTLKKNALQIILMKNKKILPSVLCFEF